MHACKPHLHNFKWLRLLFGRCTILWCPTFPASFRGIQADNHCLGVTTTITTAATASPPPPAAELPLIRALLACRCCTALPFIW
jgi:hypothetical protein